MPLCPTLTAEYESLLAKKREFDALLLQAETDPTLLDQLLTLKAELTEGKRALEDKLNPLESVLHTKEQYEKEKEMLAAYGILENRNGQEGITGMDENGNETFYPFPTLAAIRSLILENREMLKQKSEQGFVKIYITPFARKLDRFLDDWRDALQKHFNEGKLYRAKKEESDPDVPIVSLNPEGPLLRWEGYANADVSGDLVYHTKEFTKNHAGKTKQELIKASLSSKTPGYSVIFTEEMPNIPREGKGQTKGGRKQIDTAGTSIKSYIETEKTIPSPSEYLKALLNDPQYQGESGITPEENIIVALSFLKARNQVIDDWQGNGSVSYHLGAYFNASGRVPGSYWVADDGQAYAGRRDPGRRGAVCGVRSAVRIEGKRG